MSNQSPTPPEEFQPGDGRSDCGPSEVRPAQIQVIVDGGISIMGTSRRQSVVRNVVGEVREGLAELFQFPEGYEIVLSFGGATVFWDVAIFGLIRRESTHLTYDEFSSKLAKAFKMIPWLDALQIIEVEPGSTSGAVVGREGVDLIGWAHNEVSTDTMVPVTYPAGSEGQLVVIDTTSGAGDLLADMFRADVCYLSPQKCFVSDGGIWLVAMSPAVTECIEEINSSNHFIPVFLNLQTAVDNSRKNQTCNAPAASTLLMLANQVKWMDTNGGPDGMAARTTGSSSHFYSWAENRAETIPFATDIVKRSLVVGTIDFKDNIDVAQIAKVLRINGILDIKLYRKPGRNQLHIDMFPAIDPEDIHRLAGAIGWVLDDGYAAK